MENLRSGTTFSLPNIIFMHYSLSSKLLLSPHLLLRLPSVTIFIERDLPLELNPFLPREQESNLVLTGGLLEFIGPRANT